MRRARLPAAGDLRLDTLPEAASPLYGKVKDYVLGHIAAGRWRRDQRLPPENAFVQALGVSRMTVNRALTREGALVRTQCVGTFVATLKPRSALLEIANIPAEIGGAVTVTAPRC